MTTLPGERKSEFIILHRYKNQAREEMINTLLIVGYLKILFLISTIKCDDVWETDLSQEMEIGIPDGGYERVSLKCGTNSMHISLITEDHFDGVIYTRGSFHKKQPPCFLDPGQNAGRKFSMKLPFDQCQTLKVGDVYSNVLVVQHDKELIMPGDAAFNLECDFSKPRDVTVSANLNEQKTPVTSRITLTNADPGAESTRNKRHTIESENNTVQITSEDFQRIKLLRKDEL